MGTSMYIRSYGQSRSEVDAVSPEGPQLALQSAVYMPQVPHNIWCNTKFMIWETRPSQVLFYIGFVYTVMAGSQVSNPQQACPSWC